MRAILEQHDEGGRPCIVVELPELRTKGSLWPRDVMTYSVCVHGAGEGYPKDGVRHRYSDFEALAVRLQRRFGTEGMLIPPLPPKKLMGNQELDFVKARTNGLQLFMQGIATSPFMFHDLLTQKFLTRETEGGESIAELLDEVDDGTAATATAAASEASSSPLPSTSMAAVYNQGYVRWTEFLTAFTLPPDPDSLLNKVRDELDICERVLKDVLEGCKALQAGFAQYTKGMQAFSHSLHVLAEGERNVDLLNQLGTQQQEVKTDYEKNKEEDQTAATAPTPSTDDSAAAGAALSITPIPTLAAQTADLYALTNQGYLAMPDQTGFLFAAILEYELSNIHGLKALLAAREDFNVSILKLQKKVFSLQHGSGSQTNRELYESRLGKEEMHYYKLTKALLSFTVPQVARQRTRNLNRAFAHLAAISTSAAAGAFTHAHAYLSGLRWDPVELVEEANEAGAALVVPSIPTIGLMPLSAVSRATPPVLSYSSPTKKKNTTAVAKPAPGSFLKGKTSPTKGTGGGDEAGKKEKHGSSLGSPLPATDSVITATAGKRPLWESDDEADNPFEKKEEEEETSL